MRRREGFRGGRKLGLRDGATCVAGWEGEWGFFYFGRTERGKERVLEEAWKHLLAEGRLHHPGDAAAKTLQGGRILFQECVGGRGVSRNSWRKEESHTEKETDLHCPHIV
jgi:hypothetical protein